jgi:signal transduction histidine kinase
MMWLVWLVAGALLGAVFAVVASRAVAMRLVQRARAAERRARDAARLAEIGAMTGGLAHEIKNPLSSIGLNAQLLAEGVDELPLDPEVKGRLTKRVGALRREVDRLRDILSDFLKFAGAMRLELRPTNVNEVVDELAEFFLPQAEAAGVRLRAELSPGPITAPLDATHFKQALLNLMLNGLQAMAPSGRGSAAAGSDGELIIRTEQARRPGQERDECIVRVIDTGPGIAPEHLEKIFTPYFTTKSGGSGLGLPTARRIVEEHGGTLEVHSEPGRGTEFTIALPTT